MSEFVLLFRGDGPPPSSPDQIQKQMQRWRVWMKELEAQGHFKSGQPLERSGKVLNREKAVTDGPYAEAKDLIGGFMLLEANDLEKACELAKGCPIFLTGGFVEVRPVLKLNS